MHEPMVESAEAAIAGGMRQKRRDPSAALGDFLTAARDAAATLKRNPGDGDALAAYNFAVARIFSTLDTSRLDPWTKPLRVPAEGGEFVLTNRPDKRKAWNPARYVLTPVDQMTLGGTRVRERVIREGLGAPLVAVEREGIAGADESDAIGRTTYGITAVARFEGWHCEIRFEDPFDTMTTALEGRTFPLAADFTAPLAVMLARMNTLSLGLARLLRPERHADTARITPLQPYDPDKTVVLVIHGLNDSQGTWVPMLNRLRGDPFIRKHYQFWYYSYPSGYPFPYSAAILRRKLDVVVRKYPLHHPMVLIGHSMGGCISHLMIIDSGDKLWNEYFDEPPEQVNLSPAASAKFTEWLVFRSRTEVGRVIFIATPHRGSDLAANWVGRIGSSLIRSPQALLAAGDEALQVISFRADTLPLSRIPNSVDTLTPNNRFILRMNTLPFADRVEYHSIIGDRGRGGNKDRTKPMMSDGVVPYWSSHLEGAASELIVPSNHSVQRAPQAIEEVRRILVENAAE